MCYSPIKIKNNKKFYRPQIDQMYLTVPCGKCAECIASARDDWFVRLQYEWKSYEDMKGCVPFVTFTYNNDFLPSLDIHDEKFSVIDDWFQFLFKSSHYTEVLGLRVNQFIKFWSDEYIFNTSKLDFGFDLNDGFCKRDLQLALKKIRQYLLQYDPTIFDENPLKYFIVCERGSEFHRSHYHVIFFVPKFIDSTTFLKICQRAWSVRVNASDVPDCITENAPLVPKGFYRSYSTPGTEWNDWYIYRNTNNSVFYNRIRGFVNYSKDKVTKEVKPFVETSKNLSYVVKYFHKLDEYTKQDNYKKFYDWYKVLRHSFFAYDELCKENLNLPIYSGRQKLHQVLLAIADYFPFTLVSAGVGNRLLSEIYNMDYEERKKYVSSDRPVTFKSIDRRFKIPSYILSRLYYNYADLPQYDSQVRYLSQFGLECTKLRFDLRIKQSVQSYDRTIRIYKKFLQIEDYDAFRQKFGIEISEFIQMYYDTISNFYSSREFIAIYSIVFRDVVCSPDIKEQIESFDSSELTSLAYDLFDIKLDTANNMLLSSVNLSEYYKGNTYNSLPQFYNFDIILDCLFWIKNVVQQRHYNVTRDRDEELEYRKDALLSIIY